MRSAYLVIVLLIGACVDSTPQETAPSGAPESRLAQLLGSAEGSAFQQADGPRRFVFPDDHGSHDEFRNEWWYFTGHLDANDGRRFGYELTLFRVGLAPARKDSGMPSIWQTRAMYFAHFAVTDVAGERFLFAERASRGGAGLATVASQPFRVAVLDWSVVEETGGLKPVWRLRAADREHAVDLTLTSLREPLLQGDDGWSRKSEDPLRSSYYYSIPRWRSIGTVRVGDEEFAVRGNSWLDREWSSSALADNQVGWDWFALQFDDGSELMYYQLRQRDGSVEPYSAGTMRFADGRVEKLSAADVALDVTASWTNSEGHRYPAGWRLQIERFQADIRILPVLANQELDTIVRYWEGATDVQALLAGQNVAGRGYVELTGYAD